MYDWDPGPGWAGLPALQEASSDKVSQIACSQNSALWVSSGFVRWLRVCPSDIFGKMPYDRRHARDCRAVPGLTMQLYDEFPMQDCHRLPEDINPLPAEAHSDDASSAGRHEDVSLWT